MSVSGPGCGLVLGCDANFELEERKTHAKDDYLHRGSVQNECANIRTCRSVAGIEEKQPNVMEDLPSAPHKPVSIMMRSRH